MASPTSDPKRPEAGKADKAPERQSGARVQTAIIDGATFGEKAVQYTVVGENAVFEGDIVLGKVAELEQAMADRRSGAVQRGVVVTGSQYRWPNGVVPYEIDSGMPDQQRIHDAIAHWEQNTVIRFVQRTAANQASYPNYVRFFAGNGCYSQVGMRGGRQDISLGTGCLLPQTIHEIGHAVGLWHEQSREDRDAWVTIHWANIQSGKEHNFNQHISDGDDVGAYDYASIMHYPRWAFTKNGQDTITPTNPTTAVIGEATGLSSGDRTAVASMYGWPLGKQVVDPPGGLKLKKILDDPITKPVLDPPVKLKKILDDPVIDRTKIKKIADDFVVVPPPFKVPQLAKGRLGLTSFLTSTGHQADVGGEEGPDVAGVLAVVSQAERAVEDAQRRVVALQTALTQATDDLAEAQAGYAAVVAALSES